MFPGRVQEADTGSVYGDIDYIICTAPFPELYNDRGKRGKRAKVLYVCYCRAGKFRYSMSV
jgi:hypothetical protein